MHDCHDCVPSNLQFSFKFVVSDRNIFKLHGKRHFGFQIELKLERITVPSLKKKSDLEKDHFSHSFLKTAHCFQIIHTIFWRPTIFQINSHDFLETDNFSQKISHNILEIDHFFLYNSHNFLEADHFSQIIPTIC